MMKERKNNKGFTLVELIIVIAVMAILGVVAAPQFIKYVEESRRSTDRQAVWEIARAAQIAYATTEDMGDNAVLVSINENGVATYGDITSSIDFGEDADGNKINVNLDNFLTDRYLANFSTILDDEVEIVLPALSYEYKSELYRNSVIYITIAEDGTGIIDFTADSAYSQMSTVLGLKQAELEAEEDLLSIAEAVSGTYNTVINLPLIGSGIENYIKNSWDTYIDGEAGDSGSWQSSINSQWATYNALPKFLQSEATKKGIERQQEVLNSLKAYESYEVFNSYISSDIEERQIENGKQQTGVTNAQNTITDKANASTELLDHIKEVK